MKGNDIIEYLEAHPDDEDLDEDDLNAKIYEWKYGRESEPED
jgi:hypothetical protein